jgi:hypothetical protein
MLPDGMRFHVLIINCLLILSLAAPMKTAFFIPSQALSLPFFKVIVNNMLWIFDRAGFVLRGGAFYRMEKILTEIPQFLGKDGR